MADCSPKYRTYRRALYRLCHAKKKDIDAYIRAGHRAGVPQEQILDDYQKMATCFAEMFSWMKLTDEQKTADPARRQDIDIELRLLRRRIPSRQKIMKQLMDDVGEDFAAANMRRRMKAEDD